MINEVKIRPYFLFGLIALFGFFLLLIFLPFISALVLAGTFAIIFRPLYLKILSWVRYKTLASFIILVLVLMMVILPLTIIVSELFLETREFYQNLTVTETDESPFSEYIEMASVYLETIFPVVMTDFSLLKDQALEWLLGNFNTIFAGVFKTVISIFIFFFALFYLLKDGHKLKEKLVLLSPLNNKQDEQIFIKLRRTINSVIMGSLLIAIIQGIAGAIGFAIFGFSQPLLLGTITAILSLIPGIGAVLIIIPTVAIKLLAGEIAGGIGLLIWGLILVAPIDNLLRPYFIERGMQVHPFFILIAVLGGIILFGPIGFILGPIILSLFFALMAIYIDNLTTEK